MATEKQIEIIRKRSAIGCTEKQIANLKGLGLTRTGKKVILTDTPAVRGMIKKVIHLVEIGRPKTEGNVAGKKTYYTVTASSGSKPIAKKKTVAKAKGDASDAR